MEDPTYLQFVLMVWMCIWQLSELLSQAETMVQMFWWDKIFSYFDAAVEVSHLEEKKWRQNLIIHLVLGLRKKKKKSFWNWCLLFFCCSFVGIKWSFSQSKFIALTATRRFYLWCQMDILSFLTTKNSNKSLPDAELQQVWRWHLLHIVQ